ncbi:MAG: sigma-54 dependent transcriptional regulator [Candidatus Manganitrophus sp.]|nr:sigma-54 dependent transcriptional regulator [Candidatus Manganitrophus sp.]WDT80700.1 MAG: sigma-54 dependent transcriptional regulator [Candidatus Manganitrophus sp.]
MIGESPSMQQIYRLIEDVSGHPVTVLIRGEHGTGKELVARAIHEASARRNEPFIAVNCAAIPLDLIESELFGHEKGAFTGAQTTQKGKIEEADRGTLFLDEIGELSPAAQAKLLRFLQGKVVMRLGSARETPVDTRVVAATNKDLERAVEEGTFRADLYYRIKVVQILLPPLRDRKEDIPLLAAHFIERLGEELNLPAKPVLTDEALHRLQAADWPGNVRQMENAFYSALVRSRSPQLLDETLLFDSEAWNSPAEMEDEAPLDAISKELLLKILKESSWDTAKAAETLKVSRGTVYYKLKKYGINLREAAKRSANM